MGRVWEAAFQVGVLGVQVAFGRVLRFAEGQEHGEAV